MLLWRNGWLAVFLLCQACQAHRMPGAVVGRVSYKVDLTNPSLPARARACLERCTKPLAYNPQQAEYGLPWQTEDLDVACLGGCPGFLVRAATGCPPRSPELFCVERPRDEAGAGGQAAGAATEGAASAASPSRRSHARAAACVPGATRDELAYWFKKYEASRLSSLKDEGDASAHVAVAWRRFISEGGTAMESSGVTLGSVAEQCLKRSFERKTRSEAKAPQPPSTSYPVAVAGSSRFSHVSAGDAVSVTFIVLGVGTALGLSIWLFDKLTSAPCCAGISKPGASAGALALPSRSGPRLTSRGDGRLLRGLGVAPAISRGRVVGVTLGFGARF